MTTFNIPFTVVILLHFFISDIRLARMQGYCQILYLLSNMLFQVRLMLDDWPFGGLMCSLVPFTQSVSVFVSSYTMTAIAVDRYMTSVHSRRPS